MDNEIPLEFSEELLKKFSILEEYDKSLPVIDKRFAYGTCGFRYPENELERVSYDLIRFPLDWQF